VDSSTEAAGKVTQSVQVTSASDARWEQLLGTENILAVDTKQLTDAVTDAPVDSARQSSGVPALSAKIEESAGGEGSKQTVEAHAKNVTLISAMNGKKGQMKGNASGALTAAEKGSSDAAGSSAIPLMKKKSNNEVKHELKGTPGASETKRNEAGVAKAQPQAPAPKRGHEMGRNQGKKDKKKA
jgi:hypothetical protein